MNTSVITRLRRSLCCVVIAAPLAAFGQGTLTFNFDNLYLSIPDNDPNGVQNSQTLTALSGTISSLQASLNIEGTGAGAFNGDYYVALVNGAGGFAVLLNRAGKCSANPFGYGDNGFNVTFSDAAAYDIHFYQDAAYTLNSNGQLAGRWQPDGENISPLSDSQAFDSALQNQTALLNSFVGDSLNDTWTLFLADLSQGGTAELVSWSLEITTVPEPAETSLLAVGLMIGFWLWRRQDPSRSRRQELG